MQQFHEIPIFDRFNSKQRNEICLKFEPLSITGVNQQNGKAIGIVIDIIKHIDGLGLDSIARSKKGEPP
ncbi:hypothetical protein [Sphingomonas yabuuchiae]|uniref:hypothetical protein n=1 Tax=Sphingomonas yabuuchiae TaxID=172044 RepID=UPI003D98A6B9